MNPKQLKENLFKTTTNSNIYKISQPQNRRQQKQPSLSSKNFGVSNGSSTY